MKACNRCSRTVRPRGVSKLDQPGTVAAGSRGMCSGCYAKVRRTAGYSPAYNTKRRDSAVGSDESRCVLARVYLTPDTFKTLTSHKIDISLTLSQLADQVAAEVTKRA